MYQKFGGKNQRHLLIVFFVHFSLHFSHLFIHFTVVIVFVVIVVVVVVVVEKNEWMIFFLFIANLT